MIFNEHVGYIRYIIAPPPPNKSKRNNIQFLDVFSIFPKNPKGIQYNFPFCHSILSTLSEHCLNLRKSGIRPPVIKHSNGQPSMYRRFSHKSLHFLWRIPESPCFIHEKIHQKKSTEDGGFYIKTSMFFFLDKNYIKTTMAPGCLCFTSHWAATSRPGLGLQTSGRGGHRCESGLLPRGLNRGRRSVFLVDVLEAKKGRMS